MPFPKSASSNGGKTTAKKLRKEALYTYYQFPNICKQCRKVIQVADGQKISEVRKKQFCNGSCAQTYNNKKRIRTNRVNKECSTCGSDMTYIRGRAKWCANCPECSKNHKEIKANKWYRKMGQKQKHDSNFREVGLHARRTLERAGREKVCKRCGYNIHVEAAHIKPVRKFESTTLLAIINKIDNLTYLCKNHHWEFDHGFLQKEDFLP